MNIAILIFLGKALAYFIASMLLSFVYMHLLAKAHGENGGYFMETEAIGWILMFLILNNVLFWLVDPIAHISIVWV